MQVLIYCVMLYDLFVCLCVFVCVLCSKNGLCDLFVNSCVLNVFSFMCLCVWFAVLFMCFCALFVNYCVLVYGVCLNCVIRCVCVCKCLMFVVSVCCL